MKGNRNDFFPQPAIGCPMTQPGLGWRTAAASFGSVKLEQGNFLRPALKSCFGVSGRKRQEDNNPQISHTNVDPAR